jgi:transposase
MNIFLERFAAALGGRKCFLVMDQAGWHSSKDLKMPPNIEPVYLPPHSPALNPAERLWDWLKRNIIRNHFFHTLDEVMDSLGDYMKNATPSVLKSMCGCNYLLQ